MGGWTDTMSASHLLLECCISEDDRTDLRLENSPAHPDADFCPHLSLSILLPSVCLCLVCCWAPEHLASDPTLGSRAMCKVHCCVSPLTFGCPPFWLQIPKRKNQTGPHSLTYGYHSPPRDPTLKLLAISDFVFLLIHHQERNECLIWAF